MRKYTVQLTMMISVLSLVLMLFGLGWTIQNQFFSNGTAGIVEQTQPEEQTEKEGKVVVALGDSLTRGTGDDSGKGYIGYLVDELEEKSEEKITIHNYGVKGYRSNQLLEQLKQGEVQRKIKDADYILITIGGNDLFQSGQTFLEMNEEKIVQARESYLKNLQGILSELRTLNDSAVIFHIGLYNPFIDLNDSELTTKVVRDWNYETNKLLDQQAQAVYVPTFDLFQLSVNDFLYTDKFHPNAEGYRLIAERVASLITW
ncbi:SGNH/GDSL hydrolase family protein [Mesobacillus subterraneus]|uniref:GDSL family lipase n=1 Tax=Mesobacillus subterraneus TaxID=285983 RepID=A0A427TW95_9BACI|nr:SGNH/GDSL hydrolase family protein [Mesobacillus subterraneus]RSD28758.1 GDSL family lipase [Mesobacillus subterraneus]